jgi:hypothetical protein
MRRLTIEGVDSIGMMVVHLLAVFAHLMLLAERGIGRVQTWLAEPVSEDMVFMPIGRSHPAQRQVPRPAPVPTDILGTGNGGFGGGVARQNLQAPCWIHATARARCGCATSA